MKNTVTIVDNTESDTYEEMVKHHAEEGVTMTVMASMGTSWTPRGIRAVANLVLEAIDNEIA